MFLSMVLITALCPWLVSLTEFDEGFTKLPTDWGLLICLPKRVISFRSSKILSLFLKNNSVSV